MKRFMLWIRSVLKPNHCPACGRRFNEWFFWPGEGDYCWPCWRDTGEIITRRNSRG